MGAVVELLRPDFSVAARVFTNSKGHFSFADVAPGRYALKAMGASFLPSMRENVRVQANTVVNLTLNTLYEVIQWLPAQPRQPNDQRDDWAWTLRSAANRPLLRWLEDGPLVVVSDGPHARPQLKARLMATGRQGTFGEDGQRISAELQDTPSDSRELLAQVDFDPGSNAGMESMLGFRQELGFAGSVQSVAELAIQPEIEGAGAEGLDEATMRTWQSIRMGDMLQAEIGSEQVLARFAQNSPNMIASVLPFAMVGWNKGNSTIHYRLATAVPGEQAEAAGHAGMMLPAVAVRNGRLALEHGLHQELGWERRTDDSGMAVLVYADTLANPMLEAMYRGSGGGDGPAFVNALYDSNSGLLRTAASGYSSAGVVATFDRRLPHGHHVRLSYANGDALVMGAVQHPAAFSQVVSMARPRRAQTYSISVSGTLDGTGTRWRASYRWQPEDTVTRVAPYAEESGEPYLNLHVRQPMYEDRENARGVDAMINVTNLLAQGQRSFVLSDGSLLEFAQSQRAISAGLAFTF